MSCYHRLSDLMALPIVFALLLAGCGGGGGSGSAAAPPDTTTPPDTTAPTSFTVSGTIQIPGGSLIDADTLPPTTQLAFANNTTATAQPITNPSSIGGYISSSGGVYVGKPIVFDADPTDTYSVALLKDQVVMLRSFPADPVVNAPLQNTSLRLIKKSNLAEIEFQGPSTSDKSIIVPADDDYYVEVTANQGPVLYLLTISQGLVSTSHIASLNHDFVPGEVLVKVRDSVTGFSAQSTDPEQRRFQANDLAKSRLEAIDGLSYQEGSADHGMRMAIDLDKYRAFTAQSADVSAWPEAMQRKWETLQFIETLQKRDDIEWAEPNYIRKAMYTPADPLYSAQWHYPLINLPAAWEVAKGNNVVVAVIDTGVAKAHSDLAANLTSSGYDFISNASIAGDGDGRDSDPEDNGSTFHGSHVAGTVAAVEGNSNGGVGVAYNSKIMPLRVLGVDGSGNDADIAQAILYAAQETNISGTTPAQRADVINLSLGGPGFSNSLQSAVNSAVNKGVIVIAAAGNESSAVPSYPAAFSNVISVSAVGQTSALAPYSNFGSTISVAAPGGNMQQDANGDGNVDGILSTVNASSYAWFQGTSMAAPHVAGVAALMKSINAGMDATTFKAKLEAGLLTDDLGATGRDDSFGYGLINASKAVTEAGGTIAPFLSVSTQGLSFDGLETTASLTLSQGGSGSVRVTGVSDTDNSTATDADWLTVIAQGEDSNNLGTYVVTIDRTNKPVGTSYSATITINYEIDNVAQTPKTVSVLMTVPDPSKVATVGTLYVGLIERTAQEAAEDEINQGADQVLIEIFRFQEATENNGVYEYAFSNVPNGDYFVFASTNMDQDNVVSDRGEAQGDYPVVGEPTMITVRSANLTNLNFTVGYLNVVEGLSTETGSTPQIIRKIPEAYLPELRTTESSNIQKQN